MATEDARLNGQVMMGRRTGWEASMRYVFGGLIPRSQRVSGTRQPRYGPAVYLLVLTLLMSIAIGLHAEQLAAVAFSQSVREVAVFDFIEVTAKLATPAMQNPFTDSQITGDFEQPRSADRIPLEGFCDSADGTLYRIRFMPSTSGGYTFHVTLKAGAATQTYSGTFTAVDQHRRGPLRVDPAYPWHFVWEGTGEHYFFNGTTAYWLVGWRDERTIQYSIDRLAALKVNRMRVALAGRERVFLASL